MTELPAGAPRQEASAEIRNSAHGIRSLYLAYLDAGFTEKQALELVKASLAGRSR